MGFNLKEFFDTHYIPTPKEAIIQAKEIEIRRKNDLVSKFIEELDRVIIGAPVGFNSVRVYMDAFNSEEDLMNLLEPYKEKGWDINVDSENYKYIISVKMATFEEHI